MSPSACSSTNPASFAARQARPARQFRFSADQRQKVVQAYLDGATMASLAKTYAVGRQSISELLRREGIEPRRRPTMTVAEIDQAVQLYKQGLSLEAIGQRLGWFNTTIYNYDDRFRGIYGSRHVVLMHQNDIDRFGLKEGDLVALKTAVDDGVERKVAGLRVVVYDIPEGCIAGYYPECNPLLPLWHHEEKSKTPAAKSIPVRVHRQQEAA